jgi:hypothetical protein
MHDLLDELFCCSYRSNPFAVLLEEDRSILKCIASSTNPGNWGCPREFVCLPRAPHQPSELPGGQGPNMVSRHSLKLGDSALVDIQSRGHGKARYPKR